MKTGIILARFQPIHLGHLELIQKAMDENDEVIVFIGSIDKLNSRNPIPWKIRYDLVNRAIQEKFPESYHKIKLIPLRDLTDESDNSHDWGFYLFSNIVKESYGTEYTMYYSDGYEIITSWFPSFILTDHINLSLLARNACHSGISATEVRELILEDNEILGTYVPKCICDSKDLIKTYLQAFKE